MTIQFNSRALDMFRATAGWTGNTMTDLDRAVGIRENGIYGGMPSALGPQLHLAFC